jgi:YVTN family beta-propeller protein
VNLWVANFYSKSVTRLNSDGSVRDRITVEDGPAAIGFYGGFVMVLNYGSRSVSQIDPQTAKVVKTFTVGRSPVGLAFDGAHIWVANGGNDSVSRVKTSFAKPAP